MSEAGTGRDGSPSCPNGRDRSPNGPAVGSSCRDDREDGGFGETALPVRKRLPHDIPAWLESGAVFFITVCAEPRGTNALCLGNTPSRLWDSLVYRAEMGQLWPHLALIMPDHLHALLSFAPVPGMRKAVSDWKRFIARSLGVEWQRDFFDHRLRKDESFVEKAYYIRMNPVRAGLVERTEDWPYVWTMNGALGESALPAKEVDQ